MAVWAVGPEPSTSSEYWKSRAKITMPGLRYSPTESKTQAPAASPPGCKLRRSHRQAANSSKKEAEAYIWKGSSN